jgi:phosphoenolpyruvate-protein kinase (PTS system EI component)
MGERLLRGLPASPGEAAGRARILDPAIVAGPPPSEPDRPAALDAARAALAAAGEELDALAVRLRGQGRGAEAEIVETGVLMAADPALDTALEAAVMTDGLAPAAALAAACGLLADAIAALPDPTLAARADDVRSLGRRAARNLLAGGPGPAEDAGRPASAGATGAVILVAHELGPADVAELDPAVAGIALAGGAPTAHAAVVARGLGVPMAVGLGAGALALPGGVELVLDGAAGTLTAAPSAARSGAARAAQARRAREREAAEAAAALPAVTSDGVAVRVLVNAATAAEAQAGLRSGAEGIGLLRTELAFLDAPAWPTEAAHRAALEPVLAPLTGRTATVRVLDFGADKTPPFLRGTPLRGLALLLGHAGELEAQLRAIAAAGAATELRVLLPLVESATQIEAIRPLLGAGVQLGAMIETRAAVAAAPAIAAAADFVSIGTNDLTADVLGEDRFGSGAAVAHDPRVLAAIGAACDAARDAGRVVEVCGEAAGDPLLLPLLVGLGVRELSTGAARVGATRAAVRALDAAAAAQLARAALAAPDAGEVAALVRQAGHAAAERLDRDRPVVAVGPEP